MTRRLARGVGALVTLAAFVGAVPYALARWGNWPITGLPTRQQLRELPTTIVTDSTVFAVLTVAAWVVWAMFCASVLLEVVAVLRGVEAPRLPVSGPIQRSARHLVAALLMTFTLYRPLPAHATDGAPARLTPTITAAHLPLSLDSASPIPPAPVETASSDTTQPPSAAVPSAPFTTVLAVVTVNPGDNAWQIAETYLHDGMRWREIWDLNHDQPQPDGGRWTKPELIRPGWQLRLPANAANINPTPGAPAGPSPTTANPPRVYTVAPDDNLTEIAAQQLHDPARAMELFELNKGRPQPDGDALTDPNLIRPGWILELPDSPGVSSTQPTPSSPALAPPSISEPAPTPAIPNLGTRPNNASGAVTPTPPSHPPPPSRPASPASVASPTTVSANGKTGSPGDESTLPATAPILAGIAGATVLATGLTLHLRRLRRRRTLRGAQTRGRPPRPKARSTVRAVIAAADVALVRWAGQELAALGARLDPRRTTNAPVAVEISEATGVELLWEAPNPDAPAPWQAADGGWAWRLGYDPDAPVPADDLPAVMPGLVTIGQRDGRQLLIDLEAFGSLAVTGDPAAAEAFMRAVVLELAADDELADAYLQTVSLDIDGVAHLGRVTTDTFDTALDRLASTVASVEGALDASGTASTFEFRIGSAIHAHLELTAVAARIENTDQAAALVDVSPARRGVAAIILGDARDAGAHIVLDADGTGHLEPLGLAFRAAGLPAGTAAAIGAIFDAEASPTDDYTTDHPTAQLTIGGGQRAADESDADGRLPLRFPTTRNGADAPDVHSADRDRWRAPTPRLLVRVLGAPAIHDRPNLRRRELILAVYLACKARPVNTSSVQDAVWNGQAVQAKTVWNLVGRTRSALGTLNDGTPVLPQADRLQNTLRLADGVLTDHALLHCLFEQALVVSSSEAIDLLRQGLALVQGPPFDAAGYDWAHHTEQYVADASALIERAAEHLIDLTVTNGDTGLAREAIVRGLRGLPGNEVLYRARMRLEHQAGNLAAVRNAYTELLSFLDDLDAEPSTETCELYGQLVRPAGR